MNKTILIIEDELKIRFLLRDYLKTEGFNVLEASDGDEGLFVFKNNKVDLILLDIMMPKIDGITVLETIRTVSNLPIILLTAKGQEEDKLFGYEMGADDYVTKPFSPRVLTARVRALIRRVNETSETADQNYVQFGKFRLDFNSCTLVELQGDKRSPITLSAKEYGVLEYLVKNAGKPLSPEVIYKDVWGQQYGDSTAVAVYIQRLRKKIEKDCANPVYIETVFGMGYKFNVVP